MAWQKVPRDLPEGTVADLLMDNGKVVRAVWEAVPGTLGNCPGSRERIPTMLTAWWPRSKWSKPYIGQYEPISCRVIPT